MYLRCHHIVRDEPTQNARLSCSSRAFAKKINPSTHRSFRFVSEQQKESCLPMRGNIQKEHLVNYEKNTRKNSCFRTMEEGNAWAMLHVEMIDLVLTSSAQDDQFTRFVLPFVCRLWRDRKPFWQKPLPPPPLPTALENLSSLSEVIRRPL